MTALWVILGILGVLFLLLVIPLRVELVYVAEPQLILRYLFIKKQVLPAKLQKEGMPPKKETAKTKPEPQSTVVDKLRALLKKKGVGGFLQLVKEVLQLCASSAKNLLRHLHIQQLDICFVAGSSNAGDAALEYGEACAVLYPAVAALHSLSPIKKLGVVVEVDYQAEKTAVVATCCIWLLPLFAIKEIVQLAVKGLRLLLRLR